MVHYAHQSGSPQTTLNLSDFCPLLQVNTGTSFLWQAIGY